MNQSLVKNFALNCNRPKVTTVEQNAPQEDETNRQSQKLCPSNWSDYLHIQDDMDDKNSNQPEPPTDNRQPSTSTGTCVPQDLNADANAILQLPQSVPKVLTIQKEKGKGKQSIMETMPIDVVGNAIQLWNQMPSPPKARLPYMTWALIKPQRQIQDDGELN